MLPNLRGNTFVEQNKFLNKVRVDDVYNSMPFVSLLFTDESFNPGEEDDDIAEE